MNEKLKFVITLARAMGKTATQKFNQGDVLRSKREKRDIVTKIDLAIEKIIRQAIRRDYPSDNIYGEEFDRTKGTNDYTWVIDPIDGTKYFAAGIKLFSISIGLWKGTQPVLGVVYMPGMDDIYWAEKGRGAYCNGKKIKVNYLISTIHLKDIAGLLQAPEEIKNKAENLKLRGLILVYVFFDFL